MLASRSATGDLLCSWTERKGNLRSVLSRWRRLEPWLAPVWASDPKIKCPLSNTPLLADEAQQILLLSYAELFFDLYKSLFEPN